MRRELGTRKPRPRAATRTSGVASPDPVAASPACSVLTPEEFINRLSDPARQQKIGRQPPAWRRTRSRGPCARMNAAYSRSWIPGDLEMAVDGGVIFMGLPRFSRADRLESKIGGDVLVNQTGRRKRRSERATLGAPSWWCAGRPGHGPWPSATLDAGGAVGDHPARLALEHRHQGLLSRPRVSSRSICNVAPSADRPGRGRSPATCAALPVRITIAGGAEHLLRELGMGGDSRAPTLPEERGRNPSSGPAVGAQERRGASGGRATAER